MQYYSSYYFASTYGSGTYNTGTYNGATSTSTGSSSSGSAGGILTNTGFDIVAAITLAFAIVFAALVVRFWKRPAKKQPSASDTTSTPQE